MTKPIKTYRFRGEISRSEAVNKARWEANRLTRTTGKTHVYQYDTDLDAYIVRLLVG